MWSSEFKCRIAHSLIKEICTLHRFKRPLRWDRSSRASSLQSHRAEISDTTPRINISVSHVSQTIMSEVMVAKLPKQVADIEAKIGTYLTVHEAVEEKNQETLSRKKWRQLLATVVQSRNSARRKHTRAELDFRVCLLRSRFCFRVHTWSIKMQNSLRFKMSNLRRCRETMVFFKICI